MCPHNLSPGNLSLSLSLTKKWPQRPPLSATPLHLSLSSHQSIPPLSLSLMEKYINLRVFRPILQRAAEEYGFHFNGGLVFSCGVDFFKQLLLTFEKNEQKIKNLSLDKALKLNNEMVPDVFCKKNRISPEFCPLLQKARV
ncbi:hypothetical protein AMTRI_Chr01g130870 [Amborella trichopoda]